MPRKILTLLWLSALIVGIVLPEGRHASAAPATPIPTASSAVSQSEWPEPVADWLKTAGTFPMAAGELSGCQEPASAGGVFLPVLVKNPSPQSANLNLATSPAPTLPQDPAAVAPPLDRSLGYDIYEATRFLYSGGSPVQTGVAAGAINRRCVAVLRGNVITRQGTPLAGVSLSILNHPEFGQTLSRADGLFDLAVNGGETLVLVYQKSGYLPVQRRLATQRRQFKLVDPVVLIQPDAKATVLDPASTAAFQVARGSLINDRSGARQATLLFPQGSLQALTTVKGHLATAAQWTVRATEYTNGIPGAASMPGNLPPNSGYTYAVEFSIDEAAGQGEVTFAKPVINYTENFIGAPVGSPVPCGYYDRVKGEWVPVDNGIVIKILTVTGGKADLDVTGDGLVDSGAALIALGINEAELQQLASLYNAGQELWRVSIPHFSPWDFNWPFGPPQDAEEPPAPDDSAEPPNPCSESGSTINCDAQTLGESLPVIGTPFSLNYSSQRTPGWKVGNTLDIPIIVGEPPASLKTAFLIAEVGGKNLVRRWGRYGVGQPFGTSGYYSGTVQALGPNITERLTWDGLDGYNRLTNGRPVAHVYLRYVYDFQYYTARSEFEQSFGQFGGDIFLTNGHEYCEFLDYPPAWDVAFNFCGINMVRSYSRLMGTWDTSAAAGLGGWTFDVQHAYDPNEGVLHLGDGTDLRSSDIGPVVNSVLSDSAINYMEDFSLAPDGTLYFYDAFEKHIARVQPGKPLEIYAGNGTQGLPTGDGGPATSATLGWAVTAVTVGPDNALYLAGTYDNMNVGFIRRVAADGTIQTIAGKYTTLSDQPNGDGGLAIEALLNKPEDIAFGSDGSLYIAETPLYRRSGGNYNRIRKITSNGIITTVAGAGGDTTQDADLTGVPAKDWGLLPAVSRMAFGPDGSLYLAHPAANTVTRISTDGLLKRIAGSGFYGEFGDGGSALNANLSAPQSVAVDANGVVFIRTRPQKGDRLRRVSPEGFISTYAGRDCSQITPNEGKSALQMCIPNFVSNNGLELAPDGSLLLNTTRDRIERLAPPLPSGAAAGQTILIPHPNGSEVYEFSSAGRHLRTLNALTGGVLYRFGYNSAGHLISITDADGNLTQVERNASGQVVGILAPGGQHTGLALNSAGFLSTVTDPANQVTRLTYAAGGLLATLTDPRGGVHKFTYNPDGRLLSDQNPAGLVKTLTRNQQPGLTTVTVTTNQNQATIYATQVLTTGERLRSVTAPDGTTSTLTISDGSVWRLNTPDGTLQQVTYAPDPRWGMNVPLAASLVISTTGGLHFEAALQRTADLSVPGNPFSLVQLRDELTADGKTWRYTYTADTRTAEIVSPEGRITRAVLDAAGRLTGLARDIGGTLADLSAVYNNQGQLIALAEGDRSQTFGYNAAGWMTSHTAPDGNQALLAYDNAGQVTQVTLPNGKVVTLTYDPNGNLASLSPPDQPAHTFTYNAADQPSSYTPPALPGAEGMQWSYDAGLNLKTFTRADNSTISLGYSANGFHLSSVGLQRGTRTTTFDSAGRVQSMSDPGGTSLTYTYDGPLMLSRSQNGPFSGQTSFTYTSGGLLDSIAVNGTNPISLQYDNDDLLVGAGALSLRREAHNGLVNGSQLGGLSDAWTYTPQAEAATYTAGYNGATLYQASFTRDADGRITQKVETIGGITSSYDYSYNSMGRLSEVRKDGVVTGSYSYDGNGNRLSTDGVNASFDVQDRLTQAGGTQFTYTPNGELASRTDGSAVTQYQYDEVGNLLSVTLPDGRQVSYLIDALNRRVGKSVNGALVQGFLYQDGYRAIAELNASNVVVSRFVYGARSNVPEYLIKGGQTYRIIADQVGSPRLVVNTTNGQVAQRIDYDAWGRVLQDTNPGFQPFGFAGGLYDRDTGLVRFGLRDYDPATGRWTSKDPLGFAGGQTNLYAYVRNDPLNTIDPSGAEPDESPSPCNPSKPWDQKLRDGLDKLKKVPDWAIKLKPVKWLKDGYNKLTKAEKIMDDGLTIRDAINSPDPMDTLTAVETAVDYIPQEVPLTPMEAVKETLRHARENLETWREGLNPSANSSNPTFRDRNYAMNADKY